MQGAATVTPTPHLVFIFRTACREHRAWQLEPFRQVDPVCILLNLPDVCVNFLYKRPRSLMGALLRVFGAREFGIARTLMRHFFWTDSVVFPEMLPEGSSVILMGKDKLLPAT